MALAQSIGKEYQLFSRGKNHRKVLIQSFFYIQNYAKLFPVPVFWELWNFFLFLYYLTLLTGLIRNGSLLPKFFSINGSC